MRALVACLMCLGCGRVGFALHADAAADAPNDAPRPDALPVTLDASMFIADGGVGYVFHSTAGGFGTTADSNGVCCDMVSTLRLFENGVELGPPHARHEDIRTAGMGRFSHWMSSQGFGDSIYFSASDNSDPRANGRAYTYLPY